ncbi:metal ABC transporter permease [Dissulfurimicrobium hydrothermale]|uniref:metal ABC transporter permease n=1 Tax=Dissulfurimicrobium hydrothermale TaxID=1750598 RepID=UPI001ED9F636|nr:metal ABC transporter permease [Dissulfurimicrobium hydrothermale]UKL14363.1 metal ABC transporter permease [Dissulfurimicrobium hydrothermale]
MEILYIFSFDFMKRAFLAGTLVGASCAILGIFLVLRREAMIGHGLSHVTFGGVAIGLMFNLAPLPVALVFTLLAGLWINAIKDKSGLGGDTGIGIVSSLGMALGVMLASIAGDFNAELFSYLFGSILAISQVEVWMAGGLALVTLATLALFYNELVYATFDNQTAKTAGINVGVLDMLIAILTAVTVVTGMKVVGLLLVAALMIIPAAAGLTMAASFRQAVFMAVIFAVVSIFVGLILAFCLDWPASGSIVLLSGLILGIGLVFRQRYKWT